MQTRVSYCVKEKKDLLVSFKDSYGKVAFVRE